MSSFGNPGNGYEAWQQGGDVQPKLSILSVVSLVLSLLCITAPLGLICGIAAIFTISASAGRKTGRGLAIAGIIIGLLFSSLLVAGTIGAYQFSSMASKEFFAPVGAFVQNIEDKNYTAARTSLAATTSAVVTDDDFEAFRTAYQAKVGTFKGSPKSIAEIINVSQGAGPAMQALQRSTAGQNIIPMPSSFANGVAVVALQINQAGGTAPGQPGSFSNVGIATADGTIIWLKDPAIVPATGPMKIKPGDEIAPAGADPAKPVETDPVAKPDEKSGG